MQKLIFLSTKHFKSKQQINMLTEGNFLWKWWGVLFNMEQNLFHIWNHDSKMCIKVANITTPYCLILLDPPWKRVPVIFQITPILFLVTQPGAAKIKFYMLQWVDIMHNMYANSGYHRSHRHRELFKNQQQKHPMDSSNMLHTQIHSYSIYRIIHWLQLSRCP